MNLKQIVIAIFLVVITTTYALAQETVADNTVRIKVGTSYGSGAYIGDRLILSCYHLYDGENTKNTSVWFKNGEHYTGTLIKGDRLWDQSLIELDSSPNRIGIPLAKKNPKSGDYINASGYGRGNKISVLSGRFVKYLGNPYDANTTTADWFALTGSVEQGSSGGPLTTLDGYLIGNLWGTDGVRTVGLSAGRTSRFLLPWRNRLSKGVCRDGVCYPPNSQRRPSQELVPVPDSNRQVIDIPVPEQKTPTQKPNNKNTCVLDPSEIVELLKKDEEFLAQVKGDRGEQGPAGPAGPAGPQGEVGPQGEPGEDAELTTDHIAAMTAAIIQKLKEDEEFIDATTGPKGDPGITPEPLPIPDSDSGWSHLVLVAPFNADYWPRLEDEYERATNYYDEIRHIEPPTDRNIGPMPLLVAYSGGKPARSWSGLRDVSQALNHITRGEYDKLLLPESN